MHETDYRVSGVSGAKTVLHNSDMQTVDEIEIKARFQSIRKNVKWYKRYPLWTWNSFVSRFSRIKTAICEAFETREAILRIPEKIRSKLDVKRWK